MRRRNYLYILIIIGLVLFGGRLFHSYPRQGEGESQPSISSAEIYNVSLEAETDRSGSGSVSVSTSPDREGAGYLIQLAGLQIPREGEVYEVWLLTQGERKIYLGEVEVALNGQGMLATVSEVPEQSWQIVVKLGDDEVLGGMLANQF